MLAYTLETPAEEETLLEAPIDVEEEEEEDEEEEEEACWPMCDVARNVVDGRLYG